MENYDSQLKCAHCGSEYVHQEQVEVFVRLKEDDQVGLHVTVKGGQDAVLEIDHSMKGNPSARRQGVAIRLWCEACDKRSTFEVVQHKGNTFIETSKVS
jgi:hypothetical protein